MAEDTEQEELKGRHKRTHLELTIRARASESGEATPKAAAKTPSAKDMTPTSSSAPSDGGPPEMQKLNRQIMKIALPMLVALATDPLAGLIDTAFIGRIGAVQLAGMAIALSIFNTIAKFLNVPLVSATTTSVAEALGRDKVAGAARAASNAETSEDSTLLQSQPLLPKGNDLSQQGSSSSSSSWVFSASQPLDTSQRTAPASAGPMSDIETPADRSAILGQSPQPEAAALAVEASEGIQGNGFSKDSTHPDNISDLCVPTPSAPTSPTDSKPLLGNTTHCSDRSTTTTVNPMLQSESAPQARDSEDSDTRPLLQSINTRQGSPSAQQEDEVTKPLMASQPATPVHPDAVAGSGLVEGSVAHAASAAVFMAVALGLIEAVVIAAAGSGAVQLWGLASGTPAHAEAVSFLHVRCVTVPFTVLLLTLQGVFRGLADTKTPLIASLAANLLNIAMAPLFIFVAGWGVKGAAAAQGLAQVLPTLFLVVKLRQKTRLQFVGGAAFKELLALLKPSGFLLLRTASVTATYAFATSTLAHVGPTYAAAHQVAMSLWLATSLLADALAVAAQSLIARFVAEGKPDLVQIVADRCILLGGALGFVVGGVLGLARNHVTHIFTTDATVLSILNDILPILICAQPINMLAFVLDGVLFGAGGFKYASFAMAACAVPAVSLMAIGRAHPLMPLYVILWVWAGLTVLMLLRSLSIYIPYKTRFGPFQKLKQK